MEHYKSWSDLKKQLNGFLCEPCKGRVTYFLTRYHKVHDSYGRAAIQFDGKELVGFSWPAMYEQEQALSSALQRDAALNDDAVYEQLKAEWEQNGTYCEMDFLDAALKFRGMPIQAALESDNGIIRILAILDRRVGTRTLAKLAGSKAYEGYPEWVQQFYRFRFACAHIAL